MRYSKILRIFSLVMVLALLVMAMPVTPVRAIVELTVDPEEGSVGDTVHVVGEGFPFSTESTLKHFIVYFSNQEASTVDSIDDEVTTYEIIRDGRYFDENGEFVFDFVVPKEMNDGDDDEAVAAGTHYLYVCYYTLTSPYTVVKTIKAVAEFTVIGGDITIDPEDGPVGTEVEISGSQFTAKESITVYYDGGEIEMESGNSKTDSNGKFTCTVLVPESTVDAHIIKVAVGESEAEAEFTVAPEIFLEPASGNAGTQTLVSGTGFARRSDVVVYLNNAGVATQTTGTKGSFEVTFAVPELNAGVYDVEAEDEDGNMDAAKFTVTTPASTQPTPTPTPTPAPSPTAIKISATSGKAGSDLIITGAGFIGGGTITIKFDDAVWDTVTADASGIFVKVAKVPAGKAGEHKITISDGTNANEATFTLEAVPPSIPAPLLPQMGVKVKTPVSFDWGDVTADVPPVTYSLQVATKDDFGQGNIVLEKTRLAESKYVTTEAESVALASREGVYYWRVSAVDAAGTEGDWTGAGEFSVSKPLSFPKWALYTLFGLGALVLFGIGYWMGRRTAYYYTF